MAPQDLEAYRQLMEQHEWRRQQEAIMRLRPEPPPDTIGSARVIDGSLVLFFTNGLKIVIPMAVVSEIVAVVLAGRLAVGFGDSAAP